LLRKAHRDSCSTVLIACDGDAHLYVHCARPSSRRLVNTLVPHCCHANKWI
jgi:hypothetical protein